MPEKCAVAIEQKFDGVRLVFHKRGDRVWIFTEKKGLERSKFLPELADSIRDLPVREIILDSETVIWTNGKPGIRREFAPKLSVQTREPVSGDIRANVFDILFLDGDDLTGLELAERRKRLAKVLPRQRGKLFPVPFIRVSTQAEFNRAADRVQKIPGSEGAMIKALTGPDSIYAVRTARSMGLAKLKTQTSVSCLVIGRRKQPSPFEQAGLKEPDDPLSGAEATRTWRRLIAPEKTFIFRCAIRDERGKLQELNARQKYTEDDLVLRWVPAGKEDPVTGRENTTGRGEWRGTDDPRIWQMAGGWPNSKEGAYQYGKTFAVRLEPTPRLGKDLIEVQAGELQEWRDEDGRVRWSWTFPAPVEVVQEDRPPDTITALRKTARFISELSEAELGPFDTPPWYASFNFSGAMLDLNLWPMDRVEARALGRQLHEANGNVAVRFRQQFPDGFVSFVESWSAWADTAVPKTREQLRGAHIGKRFRNLRGLVGNLTPEDEKRVQPFKGRREVFAVAIETPETQPARLLRIGEETFATAERLARDVAAANPDFRVVLARVMGKLDEQEVFEEVAELKEDVSSILCPVE